MRRTTGEERGGEGVRVVVAAVEGGDGTSGAGSRRCPMRNMRRTRTRDTHTQAIPMRRRNRRGVCPSPALFPSA